MQRRIAGTSDFVGADKQNRTCYTRGMKRMVRVGRWEGEASKAARKCVADFVADYFRSETVWTRKEHGTLVVAARESAKNTAELERFRFNRPMERRFLFREKPDGEVEVILNRPEGP